MARCLLEDSETWLRLLPLPARTHRYSSLPFAMLSRSVGGVQQLVRVRHASLPYKLFHLLYIESEARPAFAEELEAIPACMRDVFSSSFMEHYSGRLCSVECLSTLTAMAISCRLDISRIECRHASLRRVLRKSSTWASEVASASADFVLLRQRICEGGVFAASQKKKRQGGASWMTVTVTALRRQRGARR